MKEITIDTPEALLDFIKKDTVTARAAVDVFESAFDIVAIIFIDAITREPNLEKERVIQIIKEFIDNCLKGKHDKVVLFS